MNNIMRNLTLEFKIITILSALILVLHLVLHSQHVLNLDYSIFYLDEEFSLGSVFTTSVAFLAFMFCVRAGITEVRKRLKYTYILSSALFLYYSIEESFSIRDVLNNHLKENVGFFSDLASYSWVISLGVFVLLFLGLLCMLILFETESKVRRSLMLGLLAFISVIILELVGGRLYGTQYEYLIIVGIEEFMEMLGLALFINAFIHKFTLKFNSY